MSQLELDFDEFLITVVQHLCILKKNKTANSVATGIACQCFQWETFV